MSVCRSVCRRRVFTDLQIPDETACTCTGNAGERQKPGGRIIPYCRVLCPPGGVMNSYVARDSVSGGMHGGSRGCSRTLRFGRRGAKVLQSCTVETTSVIFAIPTGGVPRWWVDGRTYDGGGSKMFGQRVAWSMCVVLLGVSRGKGDNASPHPEMNEICVIERCMCVVR